jgi:uncharacterized protein YbaR (Trm112 family)
MSLDHRLISLLTCPLCRGPLDLGRDAEQRPVELRCRVDRLAFPIRDGIPVMLESEARALVDGADEPHRPSSGGMAQPGSPAP